RLAAQRGPRARRSPVPGEGRPPGTRGEIIHPTQLQEMRRTPMKSLKGLAAVLLALLLAAPALAQQDPVAERLKVELKKKLTEAPVDAVRKIPYGNLYEVTIGSDLFYTDDKASFLVMGQIVDLKTKENVTELRMRQLNRVDFATLPLDQAVKIVRGNGSRKVAVFADPNCGYCKRFERDLL